MLDNSGYIVVSNDFSVYITFCSKDGGFLGDGGGNA